jgi:hypothetical protein
LTSTLPLPRKSSSPARLRRDPLADAAASQQEHFIVCRECGETWPGGAEKAKYQKTKRRPPPARKEEILVAEKQAVVTYSNPAEAAWRGKIEGDYWPEPAKRSRLPMLAGAVAALFFLAAFFGGRHAAVAAIPDLAGLYAAIGLPVNLDGFAISGVKAERTPTFAGFKLRVHATLRNVGSSDAALPPLAAILYSDAGIPSGAYEFDPSEKSLKAGEALPLLMEFDSAPEQAAEVVVRFRRRGETLAVAGVAQLASQ